MINPEQIVKSRLESPRPMGTTFDAQSAGRGLVRQLEPDTQERAWISASKLGKCARALSYDRRGVTPNGKRTDWRGRMVFAYGDAIESLLLAALADSIPDGWGLDGIQHDGGQKLLEHTIAGVPITCHPDGLLVAPDGEIIPLEVKSRTTFGFREDSRLLAEYGSGWDANNSYWWQVQTVMRAAGARRCYVLTCCKESGAISGWIQPIDSTYDNAAEKHVLASLIDDAPRLLPGMTAEIGPNSDGKLPWQCEYCPHWRTCWPSAEIVLAKGKSGMKNTLIVRG